MRPVRISVEHEGAVIEHEFSRSPIQVGRNPKADLCLPYDFVSSWHAVIHFDDGEAGYYDLGSTNGTEIDGRRVDSSKGVDFDVSPVRLRISDLVLTLWRSDDGRSNRAVAGAIETARASGAGPSAAVRALRDQLRPAYEQLEHARRRYDAALGRGLAGLPAAERDSASVWLQQQMPVTGGAAVAGPPSSTALAAEVAPLARALLPHIDPPADAEQARDLLRRMSEMMEVCVKGLVELQEGQDRLGKQLGVSAVKHYTGLRFALSAEEALAYLLTDPVEHERRRQELANAFSDTICHQIATLNGLVAGARALLDEIEPAAIERGTEPGLLSRFRANWKTFVEKWERLATRDGPLLAVLFGPEFARVYTEVGEELRAGWKRALEQNERGESG